MTASSPVDSFESLGLSAQTLQALREKGFEKPTSIQKACIPLVLHQHVDVVGQAQTGTGKTAAFGLPIIETVKPERRQIQALILTPTRELALQVADEITSLCGSMKLDIATLYGGQSIGLQIQKLRRGVHIAVGTPGRIQDLIDRGNLDLSHLEYVVLDEADEMLNMGFIEDIENILQHTPAEKRMLLFSATMPRPILNLAKRYMSTYEHVVAEQTQKTTSLTDQIYYEVREADKFEALCRVIDITPDFYGVVFCRTKVDADEITRRLQHRKYVTEALHGDVSQNQREKILDAFRRKRLNILVATDVAARGIDVQNLTHVINFSLPQSPESYVHRVGRTGRAGKEGTAITFISPAEFRKLAFIQKITQTTIRRQELPDVNTVIKLKKESIAGALENLIESGEYQQHGDFAQDILQKHSAQNIVAALIQHFYRDELDPASYREIQRVVFEKDKLKPKAPFVKGRKSSGPKNHSNLPTSVSNTRVPRRARNKCRPLLSKKIRSTTWCFGFLLCGNLTPGQIQHRPS